MLGGQPGRCQTTTKGEGGRQQAPGGDTGGESLIEREEPASHLQLLHLAGPAAALLAVDAADGQRQDLLLQLRVRVDLKKKSRTRSRGVRQEDMLLYATFIQDTVQ